MVQEDLKPRIYSPPVLWNPWTENAKKMSDFGDDEVSCDTFQANATFYIVTAICPPSLCCLQYPFTVCVEAGCVAEPVEVAPGAQVKSSQILRVM